MLNCTFQHLSWYKSDASTTACNLISLIYTLFFPCDNWVICSFVFFFLSLSEHDSPEFYFQRRTCDIFSLYLSQPFSFLPRYLTSLLRCTTEVFAHWKKYAWWFIKKKKKVIFIDVSESKLQCLKTHSKLSVAPSVLQSFSSTNFWWFFCVFLKKFKKSFIMSGYLLKRTIYIEPPRVQKKHSYIRLFSYSSKLFLPIQNLSYKYCN